MTARSFPDFCLGVIDLASDLTNIWAGRALEMKERMDES
jgi:hypothetical protein